MKTINMTKVEIIITIITILVLWFYIYKIVFTDYIQCLFIEWKSQAHCFYIR